MTSVMCHKHSNFLNSTLSELVFDLSPGVTYTKDPGVAVGHVTGTGSDFNDQQ